ncbi:hypothetical protein KAI37_04728 [Paenibacillus sp. S25]|nr:hypothetical protein KAI37_04728 [Paenibacillus sp. S25]
MIQGGIMRTKRTARQLKSAWFGYRASEADQLISSLHEERVQAEELLREERELFHAALERKKQRDAELKQLLADALAEERRWIERAGIHG